MTQFTAYSKSKLSIMQKATIGDYCLKNSKISQNREKLLQVEQKLCKV